MATNASLLFSTGGQFNGQKTFRPMAGKYFWPSHLRLVDSITTNTMTAARYYYVPFIVEHPVTYAGAWCYNSGAADNGKKIKIAAFNESASGGPGSLAKSFGEVTLTGASALRNFASSWSPNPGRYYLAIVSDTAPSMYLMAAGDSESTAGLWGPNVASNTMGFLANVPVSTSLLNLQGHYDYVGGTYANFPEATAITPTATDNAFNDLPSFGLYT